MTDTDKNRFVATALGLWTKGNVCKYEVPKDGITVHTAPCGERIYGGAGFYVHGPHEVPPPNLTEPTGADLLLRTLLARKLRVSFDQCVCVVGGNNEQTRGDGPTWREALLDAAYRLLKTDDRKTMEGM